MKLVKIITYLFVCCLLTNSTIAQEYTPETWFRKVTDSYTNRNQYAIDLTYELYHNDEKGNFGLRDTQYSSMVKDGKVVLVNAVGANMYLYNDYAISVFEDTKEIVVRSNDNATDVLQQLSQFEELYNIAIDTDQGNTLTLVLTPKNGDHPSITYDQIKIAINKNDETIAYQELSLKQPVPFKSSQGMLLKVKGILKIKFEPQSKKKQTLPISSNHFILKSTKGQLTPSVLYKGYTIIDGRNSKL